MERERGSIIILTLLSVLILSIIASGVLGVGISEVYSTSNVHMEKHAFYTAMKGVEDIRLEINNMIANKESINIEDIYRTADPDDPNNTVETETFYYSGKVNIERTGFATSYITGSIIDLEKAEKSEWTEEVPRLTLVDYYNTLFPTTLTEMRAGSTAQIFWMTIPIRVTGKAVAGGRAGYSELLVGIRYMPPMGQ